jgi:tetratricopeptide (TPR) repeat protein
MVKGVGAAAARRLQDAIKHMEGSQSLLFLGVGWSWLGYAHCLIGQAKTAVDLSEKGLKMHTDLGVPWWRSLCHWFCSLTHFELGDTGEARRHGELALQFSLENKERQMQGAAMAWLGRVNAKTDPTQIETVVQQILQGINLLEELGIVAESCWGYLWLGEVYAEAGRPEEALAPLKKAEAMFREMGMDYWLGKAQTALARL